MSLPVAAEFRQRASWQLEQRALAFPCSSPCPAAHSACDALHAMAVLPSGSLPAPAQGLLFVRTLLFRALPKFTPCSASCLFMPRVTHLQLSSSLLRHPMALLMFSLTH